MKANTALALLLAGGSLAGALAPPESVGRRLGRVGAALVVLIGALTLGEYVLGIDLGIDQLLFADTASRANPGRLGASTAFAVTLIGLALLFLDTEARLPLAEVFALAAGFLVVVALLGYLYEVRDLYEIPFYGSMALHTALGLLSIAVGTLCARPGRGLMGTITSPGLEGVTLRRLLPAALCLPIVLGWLRLQGQRAGFYDAEFGLALFALSNMVLFTALGWLGARSIAAMDAERRVAEERFRLLVAGVRDYAIVFLDPEGHIMSWNAGAEHIQGYSGEEVIGRHFSRFYPEQDRESGKPQQELAKALALGRHEEEGWRVRKDGSLFWANTLITALHDEAGHLRGYGKIVRDLTERRRLEGRFREVVEAAPNGILTVDRHGRITSFNREAERLFGYPREELLGRSVEVLVPMEFRHAHGGHRAEYWQRPTPRAMGKGRDLFGRRKDGTEFPLEIGLSPIDGSEGMEVLAVVVDITERKRMEEALKRERDFTYALMDSLSGIFYLFDRDGKFLSWNKEFERISGYTAEEMQERQPIDFFLGEDKERIRARIAEVFAEGQSSVEAELVAKDGARLPYFFTGRRIEVNGKPCVVGMGIDISARLEAERALQQLNEDLEERVRARTAQMEAVNRELEAFSYSVSHDLRAPLRHIHGFASLLNDHLKATLDEKAQHYLDKIAESSGHMGQLIDDLLAFSRMGRQELHKTRVQFERLVRDVIRELEGETQGREVVWNIGPAAEVWADPAMLRLVLVNLIDNALKYTHPRAVARIAIAASDERGETVCSVRDNGVGFDMHYADKLFGVFQRLHTAGEFPGTGIGLANVRRIISRHGGRTWAEGAFNAGACFYFSLPKQEDETP